MTFAIARRDKYTADIDAANAYYRESADLTGYQAKAREARESWCADIRAYYQDFASEVELREALAMPGRVYADLAAGERVRVHTVGNLYEVTDTTGAPAEPLIARMVGGFTVLDTSITDLISRA